MKMLSQNIKDVMAKTMEKLILPENICRQSYKQEPYQF